MINLLQAVTNPQILSLQKVYSKNCEEKRDFTDDCVIDVFCWGKMAFRYQKT
jgi:hypothetical protein